MLNKDHLKAHALQLMQDAGYPIKKEVLLEVDDQLSIMGYTTSRNGKTLIVVSAWSLSTDMSLGLVIHELSHVYWSENSHPSHNPELHNDVLDTLFGDEKRSPYKIEILHNVINNIQDIYADDISFKVYIKEAQKEHLNEFFLGWVRTPLRSTHSVQERWKSAELLLSAAFAQATLERHQVVDTDDKVANAVKDFLSQADQSQAKRYQIFKDKMLHLPENVTDEAFKLFLTGYLREFLKLI